MASFPKPDYGRLDDRALATLAGARDPDAVRLITERNNQRLFRAAWSVLRNRAEAEDAVQSAWLKAFAAIHGFEGRSSLSTWLTRIAINEALGRQRAARRRRARLDAGNVAQLDRYREALMRGSSPGLGPDGEIARAQLRALLEAAIARLPESYRLVFVLRDVEGLNVEETAEALAILPATVKTRHLRARRRLQEDLAPEVRSALSGTFPFAGADCAAMTERVLAAICPPAGQG
jgi:RNA polymerase sigma-70 factor (ECF subfamily)